MRCQVDAAVAYHGADTDKYLGEVYDRIYNKKSTSLPEATSSSQAVSPQMSAADHRDRAQEFYELFILGKFKIDFAQFSEAMNQESKESVIKYLKDHHRVSKKDATKMIDQYREFISVETLF